MILKRILEEVGKIDPETIQDIDSDVAEGEKVVCVLEDMDLRKLWQFGILCTDEANKAHSRAKVAYAKGDEAGCKIERTIFDDYLLMREITNVTFWRELRKKYDLVEEPSIAIRKDWQIVSYDKCAGCKGPGFQLIEIGFGNIDLSDLFGARRETEPETQGPGGMPN